MNTSPTPPPLAPEDLESLRQAKLILEYPGLAARLTDLLGKPIESGLKALPRGWSDKVAGVTRAALLQALDVAVRTMPRGSARLHTNRFHNILASASGAIGGAFGFPALPVELPVSTCVMLRSIAGIARAEGEDLSLVEPRLSCLSVFALGGRTLRDDSAETGYWAVRGLLAKTVSEAATFISRNGMASHGAPPLVRLLTTIASRFQVRVTQQVAAKAVPLLGAFAGAGINYAFSNHFQDMARGHFSIRRLERKYGTATIQSAYLEISV